MTLLELVREALALDSSTPIDDSDGPGTLEAWDSLAHVRLLAAIERTYQVRIEPEEFADAATLGQLEALLRRKGISDL